MITTLVRQDPALRGLSPWLSVTAGVGTALLATLSLLLYTAADRGAAPDAELHFSIAFTIIWLSMGVYLLAPGVRTRATDFSQGLPIGTPALWMMHHLAVFLASLSAWALLVGILFIGNRVVVAGFGAPDIFPMERARDLALYLPAGFSVVIAVLQMPARDQRTLPMSRRYQGLWALTVLGGLLLTLGLTRLPLGFVLALPLAAAAVLFWNRGRAPLTFLLAPREADAGPGAPAKVEESMWAASVRPHTGWAYRWFLFRTIHRAVMKKNALPIIGYPTMLLLGAALSGVFAVRTEEGALRFDLLIITAYMILAFFGGLTTNLHRVDPLPVSRRRLLALLMMPSVLALAAGYGIGLGITGLEAPRELIELRSRACCGAFLEVPTSRCEIAWDGNVPEYATPWGESHALWSTPIYRGSRALLYSPYTTSEQASRRYAAHQISRATGVVYSRRISEEEIDSRYLETDESGVVSPVTGGMSLLEDHPGLAARSAGPAFPILMMMVCVPGFLLSAIYLRSFRAQSTESSRNRALWLLLLVLLVAHMGQYVIFVTKFIRTWVFAGAFEIAIRKAGEAFPGSVLAVWIGCGACIYLAYRVAERAFTRIEVASKPEG